MLNYMDANKTAGEDARRQLHKNATCNLEQVLRQHPTRHQLYGTCPYHETIQVRRTRHAGHCWRSRDELIRDVLFVTPTHGRVKAGRPARKYIQQLCEDTDVVLKTYLGRWTIGRSGERGSGISVLPARYDDIYIYIYIYIYISACMLVCLCVWKEDKRNINSMLSIFSLFIYIYIYNIYIYIYMYIKENMKRKTIIMALWIYFDKTQKASSLLCLLIYLWSYVQVFCISYYILIPIDRAFR